ncbi:hypothetical protein J7M02_04480, partial [Candidatus Aerophobetes bacterium]|nr:hypothetical protein [Candidatus Aerophobetes bacterium]
AKGNINPNNGSVSFWIKPLDWGNQAESFIPIWTIDKEKGKSWTLLLYYAKNKGSRYGFLSFRSMFQGKRLIIMEERSLRQGKLQKNQWTHIVLTWNTMELKLYLDGKEVGSATYGLPVQKEELTSADRIWFMPVFFWHSEHIHKTLIDEVEVFSRALSKDEVLQIYKKLKSSLVKDLRKSILPVSRASRKVVIDGKLSKGEWEDATRVPLMKKHFTHHLVALPAWAFIKYDDKFLYVGYEVFYREKLKSNGKGRDKKVFGGDEVEFDCRLPGDSEEHYFQFSVAPNNAYAYCKSESYNKVNWEWETDFRHGAYVEPNRWTAEMAIPLKGIGYHPDINSPLEANIGLHRPNEGSLGGVFERWISWSSGGKRFVDKKSMGYLKFMPDATAIQIQQLGDLLYGKLNLRMQGHKVRRSIVEVSSEDKQKIIKKEMQLEKDKVSLKEKLSWKGGSIFSIQGFSEDNNLIFDYTSLFYIRDPFDFSFVCDAEKKELEIRADIMGLKKKYLSEIKQGKIKILASLESKDGKIYGKTEVIPKTFETNFKLSFQELPVGKYTVKVTVLAGEEKLEKMQFLERPSPIFLQDRKGLKRYVPLPWTEIKKEGNTITTRYHRYIFGKGPFPKKAWSQGQLVLVKEPSLKVKVRGKICTFLPVRSKNIEVAPDRIISEGICESQEANLRINWTRRIDYDGLIRCDVVLSPSCTSVQVDSLSLEMTVPHTAARYALNPTYNHTWTTDANAVITGFPMVWLTNDKVGFCFFTDTDANWVYPRGKKPIKLIKEKTGAIIRADIITSPVTIKVPTPYVFGLMATPGKPPRKDWRAIHAEGWGKPKRQTLQTRGWRHEKYMWWENRFLLTRLLYPEKARASIKQYQKKGMDTIPYACGS